MTLFEILCCYPKTFEGLYLPYISFNFKPIWIKAETLEAEPFNVASDVKFDVEGTEA